MGKLIPNPAADMIEGKVGGLVYVRLADGSVVVRRGPVRYECGNLPPLRGGWTSTVQLLQISTPPSHKRRPSKLYVNGRHYRNYRMALD